ncbi:MAG: hypothetical protein IJ468_05635 [Lachnospiraceae bacterium]|nr:hypothetical protein [Lachnospiraceae bacterium]
MSTANVNTPYDTAFRTLLADCPRLILPVVNEMFQETYQGNETLQFYPNEQFILRDNGEESERITDSHFSVIRDESSKRYHIECQSTEDGTILVRIFEYDSQIAVRNSVVTGNRLTVSFPNSALLALRHSSTTPDQMQIVIVTPGDSVSYSLPVLKAASYSMDEIFEKKLYFLIPFHIFVYEKDLEAIEKDAARLEKLKSHYLSITERLEALCQQGKLTEYEKRVLFTLSENVVNALAKKQEQVRKGVGSIMGGEILEYEAKRIYRAGQESGKNEGLAEGRLEGKLEGRIEAKISVYLNLRRDGMSAEKAQSLAELDDEQVKEAERLLVDEKP